MNMLIANKDVLVTRLDEPLLAHTKGAAPSVGASWIESMGNPASDDNARPVLLHCSVSIELLDVLSIRNRWLSEFSVASLHGRLLLLAIVSSGDT